MQDLIQSQEVSWAFYLIMELKQQLQNPGTYFMFFRIYIYWDMYTREGFNCSMKTLVLFYLHYYFGG
jgi:hypothetical protein